MNRQISKWNPYTHFPDAFSLYTYGNGGKKKSTGRDDGISGASVFKVPLFVSRFVSFSVSTGKRTHEYCVTHDDIFVVGSIEFFFVFVHRTYTGITCVYQSRFTPKTTRLRYARVYRERERVWRWEIVLRLRISRFSIIKIII